MTILKQFNFLIILLLTSVCFSQSISGVQFLEKENQYGNFVFEVTPNAFDMKAKKPTKTSGIYAILICYQFKGKKKALHQDLTHDFYKKNKSVIHVGFGAKKTNISNVSYVFYRRDLISKSEYPKKSDCL